jgi:hypothetical protein
MLLGATDVHLLSAASDPQRPKNVPKNAKWIPGPPAPLDLSPRGVWLACWVDQSRNVNRCKVTDYKGNTQFDEAYVAVSGRGPVSNDRLHVKPITTMELWTWVKKDHRDVPIVRLEDGTILVPARDIDDLRARYPH